VSNRTAAEVENVAPDEGLRMETIIVSSPMVRVAEVPSLLTATVAFVCIRHMKGLVVVISSWIKNCVLSLMNRIPRRSEEVSKYALVMFAYQYAVEPLETL